MKSPVEPEAPLLTSTRSPRLFAAAIAAALPAVLFVLAAASPARAATNPYCMSDLGRVYWETVPTGWVAWTECADCLSCGGGQEVVTSPEDGGQALCDELLTEACNEPTVSCNDDFGYCEVTAWGAACDCADGSGSGKAIDYESPDDVTPPTLEDCRRELRSCAGKAAPDLNTACEPAALEVCEAWRESYLACFNEPFTDWLIAGCCAVYAEKPLAVRGFVNCAEAKGCDAFPDCVAGQVGPGPMRMNELALPEMEVWAAAADGDEAREATAAGETEAAEEAAPGCAQAGGRFGWAAVLMICGFLVRRKP